MLIRKSVYTIAAVLDRVELAVVGRDLEFDGESVHMGSSRYQCFKVHGIRCAECGITGKFFALERHSTSDRFHFNLYAVRPDGSEVLMTKDHVIPKSKGGKDDVSNYKTMCDTCNKNKAGTGGVANGDTKAVLAAIEARIREALRSYDKHQDLKNLQARKQRTVSRVLLRHRHLFPGKADGQFGVTSTAPDTFVVKLPGGEIVIGPPLKEVGQ